MSVETPGQADTSSKAQPMKERILAAAGEQFYAHGIRATSADRIIEQVGITKVTFYRHFRTKSDLVVAYLEQKAAGERAWFEHVLRQGDPAGSLRTLAADIGSASCSSGFRGCAFINAAAEFSDPNDPVRAVVDSHRRWMLDKFGEVAADAQMSDIDSTAKQLMLLRDGAMINGYLGSPESVAGTLAAAFASVIAAD